MPTVTASWLADVLGVDGLDEGSQHTIRDQDVVVYRGIPRVGQHVSADQAATREMFGFKWTAEVADAIAHRAEHLAPGDPGAAAHVDDERPLAVLRPPRGVGDAPVALLQPPVHQRQRLRASACSSASTSRCPRTSTCSA
jgi:hypothetical protein